MSSRVRSSWSWTPSEPFKPAKDTTLGILLAAQARAGAFLRRAEGSWLRDGVAWGRLAPLKVVDDSVSCSRWRARRQPTRRFRRDSDAQGSSVRYRVRLQHLHLDRAQLQGALVCNRPQGLRDMNEKVYTAWFPECCAPTLITRDMHDMGEFLREHGQAVCKPLDGMGGKSIFVLEQGTRTATSSSNPDRLRHPLCDRPEIPAGNRHRGRLPDHSGRWRAGSFALQRMPAPEDHRGNLAAGAARGESSAQ